MAGRLHELAFAAVLAALTPSTAQADEILSREDLPYEVIIQASDDRYPFCPTVDLPTAHVFAKKSFPKERAAVIAATGAAMEALMRAPWLARMERLWLCTDERGLRALARVQRLPRLVDLQIASADGKPLGAKAIEMLVRSKAVRRLQRLRFAGSDSEAERSIGSDGAIALATNARLPRLRFLDLSWNPIDEDAVGRLVQTPLARQLDELNLCRTAFPADALIDAKLTNLARLCVSDLVSADAGVDDRKRIEAAYPGVVSPSRDWLDEPRARNRQE